MIFGVDISSRYGGAGAANQSFRTVSSTSSVFMDDTKARLGALQLPQQPRHEQNNAIPLYTPVDKKHNTSSQRHGHGGTTSQQNSLDRYDTSLQQEIKEIR